MEMRNKRLMEAFKKKSQAIREVMYRLTGYRVDACSDNQYKLISMYAESQADYLLFEVSKAARGFYLLLWWISKFENFIHIVKEEKIKENTMVILYMY